MSAIFFFEKLQWLNNWTSFWCTRFAAGKVYILLLAVYNECAGILKEEVKGAIFVTL